MPDSQNMAAFLDRMQEQIIEGCRLGQNIKLQGPFENIIFCGMGGSALGGRILKSYIGNKIPVFVVDDYKLPDFVNEKSLVFAVSYSGYTEETIEALKEALKRKLNIVVVSHGGKMLQAAEENSLPLIKLPEAIQPRMSYGYQVFSILKVLENCSILEKQPGLAENIAVFIGKEKEGIKNKAKGISKKLLNKIPLIYSSKSLEAAAYKWKKNFNENAKIMAFTNTFPEHNHNELNGFARPNGNFHAIFIRDREDHPKIRKRMEAAKKIAEENGIESSLVDTEGSNLLERIISTIYLGDWASYYLALDYGVDPTPVEIVEKFKKMLG